VRSNPFLTRLDELHTDSHQVLALCAIAYALGEMTSAVHRLATFHNTLSKPQKTSTKARGAPRKKIGDSKGSGMTKSRLRVLGAFPEKGEVCVAEIAATAEDVPANETEIEADRRRGRVRKHIYNLVKLGVVERVSHGIFRRTISTSRSILVADVPAGESSEPGPGTQTELGL